MLQHLIRELDFDAILEIIAAHAQTKLGRFLIFGGLDFLNREAVRERCALIREYSRLIEEGDRLSFRGLDECRPLLEAEEMIPAEAPALLSLLSLTRRIAAVRKRLLKAPSELEQLRDFGVRLPEMSDVLRWAAPKLGRDGQIPDEASPELAAARRKILRVRGRILQSLEGIRRSHGSALTDAPPTLRRDRYCLPVKASYRSKVPGLLLDHSSSGATSFIEPFESVELNNELAAALASEREAIRKILNEIAGVFEKLREELLEAIDLLGLLDALQAAVVFGERVRGRLIEPLEDAELILIEARHPLLDERLAELRAAIRSHKTGEASTPDTRKAVPLDFRMPDESRSLIISGPNAGGKTVVLKTIGVMVLMALHGIPLPVAEGSSVPFFDHFWCHVGDEQDVSADLSTFSGAMKATAEMLEEAGPRSLILYDELGSGTDPLEGAALGVAMLEELSRRGALCVVTTHLAAIAMNASAAPRMANAAMEYDEQHHRPTYKLRMGRPGRSRGLEIAESVGIRSSIVKRARDLLGGEHLELDRALKRLEEIEARTLEEKEAALSERVRMESERLRLRQSRQELETELQALPEKLKQEQEKLRKTARKRLDRALEELDEATREQRHLGKRTRRRLREEALKDPGFMASSEKPGETAELKEDTPVRIISLGREGILRRLQGHQAQVLVGNTRLWIPRSDLEALSSPKGRQPTKARVEVESVEGGEAELKLLGLDSTEARERLERFLDHADVSGLRLVRIVHGHGTGTLRRMVQDCLKEHPAVSSFSHPPRNRGGTGATEALLRD